jgi:hypothetical protein
MSRNLPEFPNLEHLKKQAKVLLRELQQRQPGSKLADAQHLVARVYGFPSWSKLKTHVESAPRPSTTAPAADAGGQTGGGGGAATTGTAGQPESGSGLFPRFTPRARRVVFFSRYWAGKRGSEQIEPEHLLLGLLEEDASLINRLFGNLSAHEAVRREIDRRTSSGEEIPRSHTVPLSAEGKRILQLAATEADLLGHVSIGTGHLLGGFLKTEDSPAMSILSDVLSSNRLPLEKARKKLVQMVIEEPQ